MRLRRFVTAACSLAQQRGARGDGEEIYSRRRIAVGAAFTASPWAYDDKIFALSEDGDAYVIRAGRTFEVVGRNPLDEFTMATPAVAQGSLFIRTRSKLYRIAEAAAP